MKSRKEYQQKFVESVVANDGDSDLLESIIPVGRLDCKDVIEVYHKDYFSRLSEALGDSFEAVWAVVGDEAFFKLCREYIHRYPSQYRDLNNFGREMPSFLSEHQLLEDYPFVSLLAEFEINFWDIFHSSYTESKFDLSTLQQENLGELTFKFNPSLRIFSWDYRLYSMWQYRQKGFDQCEEDFSSGQSLLIFKGKSVVEACEVDHSQYLILHMMIRGECLDRCFDQVEINSEQVQDLFHKISSLGVIISCN